MSSNPFRRKQNDGTPSASGRTSLDIDQERLQQVAQQAFADADDELQLQPAGSSGIALQRESPPPFSTTESVVKESTTPPQSRQSSSQDGMKGDAPEASEIERRSSPPRDSVADAVVTSSAPADTVSGSPTRRSDAPVPPPSRPSAPPAPPRPRRSVRRPRTEPIEEKVLIVEKPPTAVTPPPAKKAEDPFSEWKVISGRPESEDETPRPSPAREDSGWEKVEAPVESESSEYEEDSASEISEPPTISSISVISKPSTSSSEPENLDLSTSIQPPNPFRKKDDSETSLSRSQPSDQEKQENIPPPIRFGVQNNPTPQSVKAARQSLNVDAFKHLMLTGQAAHNPEPVSNTETSGTPKQGLSENAEHSYTPRSSQDIARSAPETEELDTGKSGPPATPPSKAKPPPPKPRGQRNSMMMMPPPPYRPETQPAPIKEKFDATVSLETASSPPKTPKPPAPLSRRVSAQVAPSDSTLSLQSTSPPQATPPPPPPSRRQASSPKDQPTTPPPGQSQEQPPQLTLNTSPLQAKKPAPPPARRASKRMSMPPGQLQAYSQNSTFTAPTNLSRGATIPAPPPPPIRKKTQLSQSTTDGPSDTSEPPPRLSSSFDILEDLTKLQREVNELMERV
ncbi:hypothetical protein TWF696_004837 [Orbilia brochopaga]|uniref:Uncharacterized protein n=1 Tax=Orbilia brochopaga TaxID=3140254 RepID=A0AAV9UYZ8_9PEZI